MGELVNGFYDIGPTLMQQLESLKEGVVIGVGLVVLAIAIGLIREIERA